MELKVGMKVRVVHDKHIPMFVGKLGTVEEVHPDGSGYVRFKGEQDARWRYNPADLVERRR